MVSISVCWCLGGQDPDYSPFPPVTFQAAPVNRSDPDLMCYNGMKVIYIYIELYDKIYMKITSEFREAYREAYREA
jgi:hypothetical protein